MPEISVTSSDRMAIVAVTDTLPVAVEPYGINPSGLANSRKKKTVNK